MKSNLTIGRQRGRLGALLQLGGTGVLRGYQRYCGTAEKLENNGILRSFWAKTKSTHPSCRALGTLNSSKPSTVVKFQANLTVQKIFSLPFRYLFRSRSDHQQLQPHSVYSVYFSYSLKEWTPLYVDEADTTPCPLTYQPSPSEWRSTLPTLSFFLYYQSSVDVFCMTSIRV